MDCARTIVMDAWMPSQPTITTALSYQVGVNGTLLQAINLTSQSTLMQLQTRRSHPQQILLL